MKQREQAQHIHDALAQNSEGLSLAELSALLKMKGKERKRLPKLLARMAARDLLAKTPAGRYTLNREPAMAEGTLKWLRGGKGLVEDSNAGRTILVPHSRLNSALPGDRVAVRLRKPRPGSRAAAYGDTLGSVERVLERHVHDIVGTVRASREGWRFVPLDARYGPEGFMLDTEGLHDGDRVAARMADRNGPGGLSSLFAVVSNLGQSQKPAHDTDAVMRHYGLQADFPADVLEEAEQSGRRFLAGGETCFEGRLDLRHQCVVTVDPEDAKDFDDAVSCLPGPDGTLELGVHIADVGAFVREGGILDEEAYRRGTSIYFPDRALPMLPDVLSGGVCSLRPEEDRLALSVFIVFDKRGHALRRRFAQSVIRSAARLTYQEAQQIITSSASAPEQAFPGAREQVVETLRALHGLSQRRRQRRQERGALDFDLPEPRIRFDVNGRILEIGLSQRQAAHELIEECMIAANEAVALELKAHRVKALARYHEAPDVRKLGMLQERLEALGLAPGNLTRSGRLAQFLRGCESRPLDMHVRALALRSMKRACYSFSEYGHFGLMLAHYTHFTSPIRRYPDLVIHRMLRTCLWPEVSVQKAAGDAVERSRVSMARHLSQTERDADQAARDAAELMTYRYWLELARARSSEVYPAVVVAVKRYSVFVELPAYRMQGLVKRDTLASKGRGRMRRSKGRRTLDAGSRSFKAGDQIGVTIASVDIDRRELVFRAADAPR